MRSHIMDILPHLPLFQGVGYRDMENLEKRFSLEIHDYKEGEIMAQQDSPCTQLIIPFKGTILMHTWSADKKYMITERLQSPIPIQPEALYGISPCFTRTFQAQTEVSALCFSKDNVTRLFEEVEVFRLNVINMFASRIYRNEKWLWRDNSGTTARRLISFLQSRCLYPAGEKTIHISMACLAAQINDTRNNVSQTLNDWQNRQLILQKRKCIIIPLFDKLIKSISLS